MRMQLPSTKSAAQHCGMRIIGVIPVTSFLFLFLCCMSEQDDQVPWTDRSEAMVLGSMAWEQLYGGLFESTFPTSRNPEHVPGNPHNNVSAVESTWQHFNGTANFCTNFVTVPARLKSRPRIKSGWEPEVLMRRHSKFSRV